MKPTAIAALMAAVLLLSGCGDKTKTEPPQNYALGDSSLPSLNALVDLGTEYQFTLNRDEDSGEEEYVYTGLTDAGACAQEYTQTLESEWECRIGSSETDANPPDFFAEEGQALAVLDTEDPDSLFLVTIRWEASSCTVVPSLGASADLSWSQEEPITLKEAVEYMEGLTPSQLGLPGSSMKDYEVFAQEGTAFLNDEPCLCMNVYRTSDHQLAQSYLLTVPGLQVYRLDRQTGEAYPLDGSAS